MSFQKNIKSRFLKSEKNEKIHILEHWVNLALNQLSLAISPWVGVISTSKAASTCI